jgi:tetratricopeptide (TPR) repeat protein
MAQQLDENCPLCFYNIGNMFFIKGDFKKAFWCWQKTASLEPNHPQINYRLAQACWNMDNNVNAKHYFIEELRLNAGDVEVIFDFGLFLLHGGDVAAAKEKFNRILEVEPAHSEALFYRGEIELNNGNAALAEQFYRRATDSDSRLAGPRFRLGAMALEQGRKEEAFVLLAAELELDIGQSEVLSSIGQMMMALGQKDYAMHCFLRAVETDSPKADNYINLASALAERGEDSEAEQFLEYALELGQFSREVTLSVVRCYLVMKRFEKAEMLLQSLNCSSFSFAERFFRYYVKLRFLTSSVLACGKK